MVPSQCQGLGISVENTKYLLHLNNPNPIFLSTQKDKDNEGCELLLKDNKRARIRVAEIRGSIPNSQPPV
jgi:hypothetical protein